MNAIHPSRSAAKRPLLILVVLALLASTMIPALADSGQVYRLAGDFNGDGITTPGWFTDGEFVLYGATDDGDTVRFRYGRPGDIPVVGDWAGDKRDTVGVVRNGRRWLLRDSNTGGDADRIFIYGGWLGRDRPVVGDWTGKGYDAPGVVRGTTWYLRTTLSAGNADITFTYGRPGDVPVVGDWTDKGRDTAGVVRDGVWHLRDSNRGGGADHTFNYGRKDDVPVSGNWDGRGGDTPGVIRGTTWMLKNTLSGGSADVTLDLSDPAVSESLTEPEIVALKKPTMKPAPAAPRKPSPESESKAEPAPSTELVEHGEGAVQFRYFQFDPTGLKTSSEDGVQLSSLELLVGGQPVVARSAQALIDDSPRWEGAANVIDGKTSTKWFSPSKTDNAVILDMGSSVAVDGYRWATANDRWGRDPVSWRLLGSSDGENFTLLDVQTDFPTTGDRLSYLPDFILGEVAEPVAEAVDDGTQSLDSSAGTDAAGNAAGEPTPVVAGSRFLYSDSDLASFQKAMSGSGPFFSAGDAGHGGQYSPGDGQRSLEHARAFLADPQQSYWRQGGLPYSAGDPAPLSFRYAYPMHAAWVYMTVPDHPDRDALGSEVKRLLLAHATDPTLDFSNSANYPVNYPGWSANPIFEQAQWISRLFKARDMLGRELFTDGENATLDQWMYGYANWSANWLHRESVGKYLPGRLSRDYSTVRRPANASRASYDGGPLIGDMAMTYNNRNAMSAAAMSLAANYLAEHGYRSSTRSNPSYGQYSVDQLLDHSRLFVEETLRFSVFPQGVQGDFERGDGNHHNSTARQGWLYAINMLSLVVEMADYHAKRGDMSLWEYGTSAGYDGTAGKPIAGGFDRKSLHFFAWAMSRYMNDGWSRTNRGEPLVLDHFFHDVIPAAIVSSYYPNDALLEAAWKREGLGFPAYGQRPQSQGPWHAHYGEGAKQIGLIEHMP